MKLWNLIARITSFFLATLLMVSSVLVTNATAFFEDVIEAPTMSELKMMASSPGIKTSSNTGAKLVLPTEKEMIDMPFRAYTDNGKNTGSTYIMPKPNSGNGYLGTVETGSEVWILAETEYYYFFVTDDGWMGWNGKTYFNTNLYNSVNNQDNMYNNSNYHSDAPTLADLEAMATSRDIKNKSNTGVKLVLPSEKEMLDNPFRSHTDNGKNVGSIYIMPKPKGGNGYLGTADTDTEVWIVAETKYYYFFVTDDGWMGWNGKSYFS